MGKLVITGATGRIGRAAMELLAQRGVPTRAVSRQPDRIAALDGVERVAFDFQNPATFDAVLEDADGLFLIVPPGASDPAKTVGPFLEKAVGRVRKIVASTLIGSETDPESPFGRLEKAIESSGVAFTLLRPNVLMDNFHTLWADGINRTGAVSVPAGDSRTATVEARDVGACAAVALSSETFDGRAFTLTGPEGLTYEQAAAVISQVSGKPVRYEDVNEETFGQSLPSTTVPPNYVKTLRSLFQASREGRLGEPTEAVAEILGRPPRTLADYAATNVRAWKRRR